MFFSFRSLHVRKRKLPSLLRSLESSAISYSNVRKCEKKFPFFFQCIHASLRIWVRCKIFFHLEFWRREKRKAKWELVFFPCPNLCASEVIPPPPSLPVLSREFGKEAAFPFIMQCLEKERNQRHSSCFLHFPTLLQKKVEGVPFGRGTVARKM